MQKTTLKKDFFTRKKNVVQVESSIYPRSDLMKDDEFKIFVEQLRDGHTEQIDRQYSPAFIDVHEKDLKFESPVSIKGDIYLAGDGLILHFAIYTVAVIPCLVCNESVNVDIELGDFYHMEPLAEIKSGVFNFKDAVREAILLQTPPFAECKGSCPKREQLKKYLAEAKKKEEGYRPFADL